MTKIAILSVQGDFLEHANIITAHFGGGLEIIYLRSKLDFVPEIDGIIIPGGESTAIRYLAIKHGLWDILLKWIKDGNPIWGTCAGLILLASGIEGSCNEHTLQGLSIVVSRNAYGSQVNSFVSAINSDHIKDSKGIFIRAPIIKDILSSDVEILGTVEGNQVVAVRQGYFLGTTFHPELSDNFSWHRYFIKMLQEKALRNE